MGLCISSVRTKCLNQQKITHLIVTVLYKVMIYICFNLDINECLLANGGCEDQCMNTNGSFYCQCRNGSSLDEDGFSCKGIRVTYVIIVLCHPFNTYVIKFLKAIKLSLKDYCIFNCTLSPDI